MKSWFKKFVVVSSVLAISVAVVTPSFARPGDADTQMQVEIDQYTAKIKANPRDFDSILARGRAYLALGNLEQCTSDARKVVSLRPDMPFGYWLLAMISKQRKDYENGLFYIRESIKREQFDPDHVHYEMSCLRGLKRYKELFNTTVQLEKKSPRDPEVFYFRAFARAGLNESKGQTKADLLQARRLASAEGMNDFVDDIDKVLLQVK